MSAHEWEIRELDGSVVPHPNHYDLDVTDGIWGRICTCSGCGLRALSSNTIDMAEVEGLPECRPRTYQAMEQVGAELIFASAEAAAPALDLTLGSPLPPEVAAAIAILTTRAASVLECGVSQVAWGARQRRMLAMSLELLSWWMRDWDEKSGDVNWRTSDDEEENDEWEAENARFEPGSMVRRVEGLRDQAARLDILGEVMET